MLESEAITGEPEAVYFVKCEGDRNGAVPGRGAEALKVEGRESKVGAGVEYEGVVAAAFACII